MDQTFDEPSEELDQPVEVPEEEAEPQEPVLVQIRVEGKTLMVTEDVADAWHRREEIFTRKLTANSDELGRYRQQQRPARQESEESAEDADLEYFQSPTKAIAKALEKERELRRQEVAFERAQNAYWGSFYTDHSHLRGKEMVVNAVFNQNTEYLATLGPAQSRRELADFVTNLLKPEDQGTKRALPQGQATTERASNAPPTRRPPPKEKPTEDGVGAVVRARQQRFSAAFHRIPEDK